MELSKDRLYPQDGVAYHEDYEARMNAIRNSGSRETMLEIARTTPLLGCLLIASQVAAEELGSFKVTAFTEVVEEVFLGHAVQWMHRPRTGRAAIDDISSMVHVNDAIRLECRNSSGEGQSMLSVYGHWWKIMSGTSRGSAWYITSIKDQHKSAKTAVITSHTLMKVNDPLYKITKIVSFPEEFSYKKHGKV